MKRIDKVYVALDNLNKHEVQSFIKANPEFKKYKIGLELYLRYGKSFVEELCNEYDIDIFLDLKLHDIPNTVAKAIESLEGLKLDFLTIHLAGGPGMIEKAAQARDKYLPEMKLLGVSFLTSLDNTDAKKIFNLDKLPINEIISFAETTSIDALVCPALSLARLNTKLPKICTRISFDGDNSDDQKSVVTPKKAIALGADFLVIGRSLTKETQLKEKKNILLSL